MKKKASKPASKVSKDYKVCKEEGCQDQPQVKGFCRLHFLKLMAGKAEGSGKPRAKLEVVKERRGSSHKESLEPVQVGDEAGSEKVRLLGELDTDFDDTLDIAGIPMTLDFDFEDTGS